MLTTPLRSEIMPPRAVSSKGVMERIMAGNRATDLNSCKTVVKILAQEWRPGKWVRSASILFYSDLGIP
ncbi:MAG: hypothetical protein OHK0012_14420 [Synechococcales cyanobacterium]